MKAILFMSLLLVVVGCAQTKPCYYDSNYEGATREPRRFGQTSTGQPWRQLDNGLIVVTDPMTGNTTTIRR